MKDDVLVSENDLCRFYTNDMIEICTKYARDKDVNDISLDGWYVLLVEEKINNKRTFILINNLGNISYENTSAEAIGAKIDILKTSKQFNIANKNKSI